MDALLTAWALKTTQLHEANPAMAALVAWGGLGLFVAFKVVVGLVCGWAMFRFHLRVVWWLTALYFLVIIWNLFVIFL